MKKTAVLFSIISFFFVPAIASAESSSTVNVHTEGSNQSTTCINGNCTTSGTSGKSTVCVNGKCTSSGDGNVNYQSDDGQTQIHINTNTDNVTTTPEPSDGPTDSPEVMEDMPSTTPDPTMHPSITQKKKEITAVRKHVQKMHEDIKLHIKEHDAALSTFVQGEMDSLQKLMDNLFK